MAVWKVLLFSCFMRVGIVSVLAKSCDPLPDVPHGSIEYSKGVDVGSVAQISCEEGYNIVGRNQRVCRDDGWDEQNPVCKPKTCAAPPEIVDGTVDLGSTSQDIAVGTVATYSCKKFQLIGNATIYCTKSGSWSGSPPVCKGANIGTNPKTTTEKKNENVDSPVAGGLAAKSPNGKDANCPEPQVAHGHKTGKSGPTYRSDDTIKFECEPGYWMNGHSTITCKDDNEWHPSPPTCDDEEDKEKKKRIIGLAVGIPLAVIVLAAIIVLIYYCCCLKKKEGK